MGAGPEGASVEWREGTQLSRVLLRRRGTKRAGVTKAFQAQRNVGGARKAAKVALMFLFLGECEELGTWGGKVGAEV